MRGSKSLATIYVTRRRRIDDELEKAHDKPAICRKSVSAADSHLDSPTVRDVQYPDRDGPGTAMMGCGNRDRRKSLPESADF